MFESLSFSDRADLSNTHPLNVYLFHLIAIKQSNLCVSADVTSTAALLKLANEVGDHICVLKTHADIIDDFGPRTIKGLQEIARRKKFLLFEDRKFGDIGNTVQSQYTRGPLQICRWAHLTNAHIFPGPAIIDALQSAATSTLTLINQCVSTEISAGTPRTSTDGDDTDSFDEAVESNLLDTGKGKGREERTGRKGSVVTATTTISQTFETHERSPPSLIKSMSTGEGDEGDREEALLQLGEPPFARGLLLLAEMSSKGNLMDEAYTRQCVQAARHHSDFVAGFISQRSLNEEQQDHFLSFTPGVSLPPDSGEETTKDGLGQQYRTPGRVIAHEGCDIIIVGRGILGAHDRAKEAKRYKRAAWKAYESRIN